MCDVRAPKFLGSIVLKQWESEENIKLSPKIKSLGTAGRRVLQISNNIREVWTGSITIS